MSDQIVQHEDGTTVFTGQATRLYQLRVVIGALKLEKLGMRRRGGSAVAKAQELTGSNSRNKDVLINLLEHKWREQLTQIEIVVKS